jgi:hypothetical protein
MASGSSDLYRSCLGVAGLAEPAGLAPLLEAMAAAGVLRLARAAGAAGGEVLFVTDIERKGMAMCVRARPREHERCVPAGALLPLPRPAPRGTATLSTAASQRR